MRHSEITYVHVVETSLDVAKCAMMSDVLVDFDLALQVIYAQKVSIHFRN